MGRQSLIKPKNTIFELFKITKVELTLNIKAYHTKQLPEANLQNN